MDRRQHHVTDALSTGARQYDQTGCIWLLSTAERLP